MGLKLDEFEERKKGMLEKWVRADSSLECS
jgi:hypothetical protein